MRTDPKERFASVAELKEELFRPVRGRWLAAAVLVLVIVLSAFILVHSSDFQPVTTDFPQNSAPGSPAGQELLERTGGTQEEAVETESEEASDPKVPDSKSPEKVVDAQDIDNLFREATDLFL